MNPEAPDTRAWFITKSVVHSASANIPLTLQTPGILPHRMRPSHTFLSRTWSQHYIKPIDQQLIIAQSTE